MISLQLSKDLMNLTEPVFSYFHRFSHHEIDQFNPLPHGVLATFSPTAGGPMGPPKKDDISREKTILMTSLRAHRASAVSSPGLHYTYPPPPPCAI